MALDKAALKTGLKTLMDDMLTREENSNDEFANRLSDLIETFVKSGKVKVGIHVNTTGTATAQSGATTTEGEIY